MTARRAQIAWQGASGQFYTLTLDASVHETHAATSTVTDHPVERGSNVADHIRPDPDQLTIEGHISNTPHFLPADHVGGITVEHKTVQGAQRTLRDESSGAFGTGLGARIGLPTGVLGQFPSGRVDNGTVVGFSGVFDRVTECYKELLRIRDDGQLVRVITTLRTYENMAMTSLEVQRDVSTGKSLALSLAFKNVRFGATKNEPLPKRPVKAKPKGAVVKEAEEQDDTSALRLWVSGGR